MSDMFTNAANLKGTLDSSQPLKIFLQQHSSSARLTELRGEFASGTSTYKTFSQSKCYHVVNLDVCYNINVNLFFLALLHRFTSRYICFGR